MPRQELRPVEPQQRANIELIIVAGFPRSGAFGKAESAVFQLICGHLLKALCELNANFSKKENGPYVMSAQPYPD